MRIKASSLLFGSLVAGLLTGCGTGSNGTNGSGSATTGGVTNGGMTNGAAGPIMVTTIAGKGPTGEGMAGGDAGTAEFDMPAGITFDSSGNLYVADSSNNAIRMLSANGLVSTIDGLGFGMTGLINGGPKFAEFSGPLGVAIDSTGIIYVADTQNSAVRKIDTSHNVSTLVQEQSGTFIASGNGAGVRYPSGIVVDSAGNIYVSDSGNNAIRKVDPAGNVSTIVGGPDHVGFVDGDAGTAMFQPPVGIAIDSTGTIYFADEINNAIRKVDGQGNVSTLAGLGPTKHGFIDGDASTAQLFQPYDIALDSAGNVYVADQRNNAIRKIDSKGNVSTLVGKGPSKSGFMDGDAGTAEFDYPAGVAVDSSGNIYVADQNNNAIRVITP